MRRRPYALCCYALALAQAFLGVGCQDTIDGGGSRASSVAGVLAAQDLGQVAFGIYRGSVAAEPTGASRDARLAALDAHRQPFVDAVNDIANVRTLSGVGQTIEALFALVDDGTLPTLAETTAQFLEQLAADPQATDALARLFATPHAMPTGEGSACWGECSTTRRARTSGGPSPR